PDFPTVKPFQDTGPQAAGVVLTDNRGRVCLQLRDAFPGVEGGGSWGFFGGHREPGETLAEAASRELGEELGITLDPASLRPLARTSAESGNRIYIFVTDARPDARDFRLGEGAGFAFLSRAQTEAFPMLASTARILGHYWTCVAPNLTTQ
ncbi:MAG: NUDIX hydrolase, partial [Pseudomonadota bacterium]